MTIPMSAWKWDGHAGHLIVSAQCRFHLTTTVGAFRVSTVGDWFPDGWTDEKPKEIGAGRTHETLVFLVGPDGEVELWSEVEADVYNDCASATAGHMAMCRKYARSASSESPTTPSPTTREEKP